MGIQYTPGFQVPYMDENTGLTELDEVTKGVAEALDAAMGRAGYTPPSSSSFAALSATVADIKRLAIANPQRYNQPGTTGTVAAGATAVGVHPNQTINPQTLWGVGFAAIVHVESRLLIDVGDTAPNGAGFWYLDNTVSLNGAAAVKIGEDAGQLSTRLVLKTTATYPIPAGGSAVFATIASSPGVTGSVKKYADGSNNRTSYVAIPVGPFIP